jgi:hypothetical protein
MLREAAASGTEQSSRQLMESVGKNRRPRLLTEIVTVGKKIDDMRYGPTYEDSEPASEQAKGEIIDLIAYELDYPDPKKLGRLLREGSVESLMKMSQSIEALFIALRNDLDRG